MPEVVDAPGELEEILGRLVAAGVAQPTALAELLGVELLEIGRPLRALVRVGIVAQDAGGGLQVTARGEAWLRLPPATSSAPEPMPAAIGAELPVLEPLPLALETRPRARRVRRGGCD